MNRSVQPGPPPRGRGQVRRYLETRGLVGGFSRPHATTRLRAADGTRLEGTYLPGPPDAAVAVLLLHGFAANRRKPSYARLADGLSLRFPVLTIDLRGHGGSDGHSTFGDDEVADVDAGLAWLRAVGHDRVVTVGLSMGATAGLHAASLGAPTDALVTVSAPAFFRDEPGTPALQRLHRIWSRRSGRAGMRLLLGIRMAGPRGWRSPPQPHEMAAALEVPWLVVHGADDGYFPASDADVLGAAAAGPTVLWQEPEGFGHAEDGITPTFVQRLSDAIGVLERTGTFPAS